MGFHQKLLEKAFFIVKMSGLAGQFCRLERGISKPYELASWGTYLRLNEATSSIDFNKSLSDLATEFKAICPMLCKRTFVD